MNWLDITLLALAVAGLAKGVYDGLVRQVVALVALVAGLICCGMAAAWIKEQLTQLHWFSPSTLIPLSYAIGFLLIVTLLLLAGYIINKIISATPLSIFNHILGGLFGLLMMTLLLSLLLNLAEYTGFSTTFIPLQAKLDSLLYYPLKSLLPHLLPSNFFFAFGG